MSPNRWPPTSIRLEAFAAATPALLKAVEMIGDVKAELIRSELDAQAPVITKLAGLIEVLAAAEVPEAAAGGANLNGIMVVVTGTMKSALKGKSRNDVNDLVGGRSSSVSRSTGLLVVDAGGVQAEEGHIPRGDGADKDRVRHRLPRSSNQPGAGRLRT